MFKVTKSSHPSIAPARKPYSDPRPGSPEPRLGTTSKSKAVDTGWGGVSEDADFKSLSSNVSMRVTGSPNTTISGNAITIDTDPMLSGMTPQTESAIHAVYRDIYYNDTVGGSAVDLISMLSFGDFNLGGFPALKGDTKAVSNVYSETMERLNCRTFTPEVAVDYLVLGEHCSSLLYNQERRAFTDIMPHQADDLTVEPLPFYSQDPIITVKFPDSLKSVLQRESSPRVKRIRDHLGADLVSKILGGSLELDPLSTIYIPRRTFSRSPRGVSYFRRLLPIYLIEKNLFRGTLVESARRQRGILHLSLGDGDQWVPSVQDMEFITELFMSADSDPIGAIIATRTGIQVDELRQGGDFWKSTDFADSVLSHKLRALSISEGFLSGDANFDTSGNALAVFLDMIRNFRDLLTRKLYYDSLFPVISLVNGFTVKNGRVAIRPNLISSLTSEEALHKMNDGSKLFIPSVQWTKQLKPEGDTAYIELLNTLTDKGVPVPLRALAAAGGMDLDTLIRQQDEDIDIRTQIGAYLKRIADLAPKPAGEGDEASESSDLLALASASPLGKSKSAVQGMRGRKSLLSRDFSACEPYVLSKTGKPKSVVRRQPYEQKANARIIQAVKELRRKGKA